MKPMVPLRECPEGLFLFYADGHTSCLGFKSEYKTEILSSPGVWQSDAYVVESGEYFWGGVSNPKAREALLVTPVDFRDGHAAGFAEAIEMAAKVASDLGDLSTVDATVADFIAAAIRALAARDRALPEDER